MYAARPLRLTLPTLKSLCVCPSFLVWPYGSFKEAREQNCRKSRFNQCQWFETSALEKRCTQYWLTAAREQSEAKDSQGDKTVKSKDAKNPTPQLKNLTLFIAYKLNQSLREEQETSQQEITKASQQNCQVEKRHFEVDKIQKYLNHLCLLVDTNSDRAWKTTGSKGGQRLRCLPLPWTVVPSAAF
ncbi:hypothetical protein PoB_003891500 [Plakobranchus ocellatus]|uniref:Uncharacterized protein n=1 Tax=Plakobranchus ocellatus TaxID=259542 RepID=A0AAV4AYP4_9GAST|nr:hypothetical protein PoB_003891500 [Plakobranchus ocellatus]